MNFTAAPKGSLANVAQCATCSLSSYLSEIEQSRTHGIPLVFEAIENAQQKYCDAMRSVFDASNGTLVERVLGAIRACAEVSNRLLQTVALIEPSPALILRANCAINDLTKLVGAVRKMAHIFREDTAFVVKGLEQVINIAALMTIADRTALVVAADQNSRIGWLLGLTAFGIRQEVEQQLLYSEMPSPLPHFGVITSREVS